MLIAKFKKVVSSYDEDGDGKTSSEELPIGNEFGFTVEDGDGTNSTDVLNNAEVNITFSLYGNKLDGASTINGSVIPIHRVTFTLHNDGGNDTIAKEFGTVVRQLGLGYSEAEIQGLVDQLDDGKKLFFFYVGPP